MDIKVLKYGNLMGSPDVKSMMHDLEPDVKAADALWDDAYAIKIAFGLDGRSTSALLIEPECPELFPAVVDCSYLCADPASYGENSVTAALDAVRAAGVNPDDIKTYFVTHPHGDHLDPRVAQRLPNAKLMAGAGAGIPGAAPLDPAACPEGFSSLPTPGHGTPHCSFIVDLPKRNLSVCVAGDLIMSHAHFLSLDHPKSFMDPEAGKVSVRAVMDALAARPTKYKMILPGHDIPFFVKP